MDKETWLLPNWNKSVLFYLPLDNIVEPKWMVIDNVQHERAAKNCATKMIKKAWLINLPNRNDFGRLSYYRQCQINALKVQKRSCFYWFCFKNVIIALLTEYSKTQCGSNSWSIGKQKVPKEALFNGLQILFHFCSKIFCAPWSAGRQISINYILME